jgi:hypothetical protein
MENQEKSSAMTSAGTAGGWYARFHEECGRWSVHARHGIFDHELAQVLWRGAEAEANARMMAGAPDLRTASQKLYDALQNYLIDVPDRDLPRWLVEGMDDLEAAWHKADGTVPQANDE